MFKCGKINKLKKQRVLALVLSLWLKPHPTLFLSEAKVFQSKSDVLIKSDMSRTCSIKLSEAVIREKTSAFGN
jgi:hypothetical protein